MTREDAVAQLCGRMSDLVREFQREHGRLPTPDEMKDIAFDAACYVNGLMDEDDA